MADTEVERDEDRFSHDELVAALLEAQETVEDDAGVMTGPELALLLGLSEKAVLQRVKLLIAAGTVEPAKKRIIDLVGRRTSTFGYRLKV